MSSNKPPSNSDDDYETVQDDGKVDKRIKDRIIDSRERVDEREDQLFVRAAAEPNISMSHQQKLNAWGTSVRQYIRTIIPLLKSDNIDGATRYWEEEPIWSTEISPPDGEYQWSRFVRQDLPKKVIARQMGLPAGVEPPQPKTVSYEGLNDILERDRIELYWVVDTSPKTVDKSEGIETLEVSFPTPKQALENAVTAADEFLQQAGVGLEIGKGKPHGKT